MKHITINRKHALALISLTALIAITFASTAFSAYPLLEATESMETMETLQGQSNSRPPRKPRPQPQQEQPQPEQTSPENNQEGNAGSTDNIYTMITSLINAGQQMPPDNAAQLRAATKKMEPSLSPDDMETSTKYHILTAWLYYFENNTQYAQQAARQAYVGNPQSQDAQITKTALSILAGRKPAPLSKNAETQETAEPKLLNLDIETIETELLGFRLQEMKLNCLNSTTLEYKYGGSNLCILLWKLPMLQQTTNGSSPISLSSEPNEPANRPKLRDNYYEEDFDAGYIQKEIEKSKPAAPTEIEAFKNIFVRNFAGTNTKFVAINLDPAAGKNYVLKDIIDTPRPWAQVMAYDNASNAAQFQGITLRQNKPMLLIAGNDGTIKYAGPPTGFLPTMVVNSLSSTASTSSSVADIVTPEPEVTASKPAYNSPRPVKQPGLLPPTSVYQELSLEDEVAAQRDLEEAKLLMKTGSKFSTPTQGIKACREIIEKYPGTKYAEEARMLLRKVPERYHKRFNITNEELGL